MSTVRISTHFNIDIDFVSPPFHRRLGAWIIDVIICIVYLYFAGYFLRSLNLEDSMTSYAISMIVWLPMLLYHLLCEIFMDGQSIGKRILGMRVVAENGGKPSIGQFLIRFLIRSSDLMILLSIFLIQMIAVYGPEVLWFIGGSFLLLIADLILVNTRKQQRLGDILANTIFQEVADSYVPSFPQVMRLSDRDINALKSILDTARKREDYNMAEMASLKIKSHLKIDTTLPAFDFLEVLLKDYNYLSAH